MWTMEELVDRVRAALAAEYAGAPNGRVRDLPDSRSIRWYSTIGLVDRPLGTRGRNALYGPRHLLQLVAIKRLQAAGRTLAEIQADLAGVSEERLTSVARVPAELLSGDPAPAPAEVRSPFWKAAPSPPAPATASAPSDSAAPSLSAPATTSAPSDSAAPSLSAPATASAPSDSPSAAPSPSAAAPGLAADWAFPPAMPGGVAFGAPAGTHEVPLPPAYPGMAPPISSDPLLTGVPLGLGVILLVPGALHLDLTDRAELATAARPLLDLLATRGLTDRRDQ
jgi:DNA-binding transcriptional MerR regulator